MGAGHPWKGEDRRVGVGPWNGATESEAGRDFWGRGHGTSVDALTGPL
jgi:hypothetical protein